jgi:hypothetical protein
MRTKFAQCDQNQSGQRFLDSSVPRLIRQVAFCKPAGGDDAPLAWNTSPFPAGKDQKLSREFEGGALIGRNAPVPASLDTLKNNQHRNGAGVPDYYRRPRGRGKFCGRYSVKGLDHKTGRTNFRRINCGSWSCSYCGPRKVRTARASIRRAAEGLNLKYFLTLTIDPKKLKDKKFAVPYLRLCFNKFREYLKRKYGTVPPYICVLEFTQAGIPHLHILLDRYIPQAWISHIWAGLGGGRIVFIKQVTIANVARYLSKYLTKELILSAPKGARRITTARSIKLFPKFQSGMTWELVKSTIWWNLLENQMKDLEFQRGFFDGFISLEFDEETFLKAFQLHPPGGAEDKGGSTLGA